MPDKAWTGEVDTSDPTGIAPRGNEPYTQPEYWEWRFEREQQNDWLVSGAAAVEVITPLLPPASTHPRVLLVGTVAFNIYNVCALMHRSKLKHFRTNMSKKQGLKRLENI